MNTIERLRALETWCSEYDETDCLNHDCPAYMEYVDKAGNKACKAFWTRTNEEIEAAYNAVHTDPVKPMYRKEILAKAAECVTGHRVDEYGQPEDSFGTIARLWTAYNGCEYTAHDVAMMMALLKVARISTGHGGVDSYIDLAGYAACAGEIAGAKGN